MAELSPDLPAAPRPMTPQSADGRGPSAFSQVPVQITVSVGRARPKVADLLKLGRDALLALDRKIDDPVELYIGDRLIARGELEELDGDQAGQLAVRLTEVADLSGGL